MPSEERFELKKKRKRLILNRQEALSGISLTVLSIVGLPELIRLGAVCIKLSGQYEFYHF